MVAGFRTALRAGFAQEIENAVCEGELLREAILCGKCRERVYEAVVQEAGKRFRGGVGREAVEVGAIGRELLKRFGEYVRDRLFVEPGRKLRNSRLGHE